MKSTFSLKKIVILVAILALPGFLYYLLKEKGKNRYKPLPFYGPKELPGTFTTRRGKKIPDTIYHTIRDFKLVNQEGKEVSFPSSAHRITIANFFYTRCGSGCDASNKAMNRAYERFSKNPLIHFISISLDPDRDTPEALLTFSKQFNALPGKWDFLRGAQAEVFQLVRKDFLLDAVIDTGDKGDILHSSTIVLLDPHKRIRGLYDPSRKESVDLLIDETKVLIAEELRSIKDR
ncbi:MAG TPA: SCO family protein [Sphingobacteriaceae bacterium]